MRRHYTEAQKAEALARLKANGGNLTRTARESGIPRNTIRLWAADTARAAPSETRHQKEDELVALYEEVERVLLVAARRKAEAGALRDSVANLMTGAGIARDKIQLLSGGATSREETRTLAIEWPDYRDGGDGKLVPFPAARRETEAER